MEALGTGRPHHLDRHAKRSSLFVGPASSTPTRIKKPQDKTLGFLFLCRRWDYNEHKPYSLHKSCKRAFLVVGVTSNYIKMPSIKQAKRSSFDTFCARICAEKCI
jgi:hypothetical protein